MKPYFTFYEQLSTEITSETEQTCRGLKKIRVRRRQRLGGRVRKMSRAVLLKKLPHQGFEFPSQLMHRSCREQGSRDHRQCRWIAGVCYKLARSMPLGQLRRPLAPARVARALHAA